MPFGLRNAAQTFQRFINEVINGFDFVHAYIDDLLIASKDEKEHEQHVDAICKRLSEYGLNINPSKCEFGKSEIEFLGHLISKDGIRPLPSKVKAIRDFKKPESKSQMRRFTGMLNFYRRFLPNIADTLAPLHKMINATSGQQLEWSDDASIAFEKAKDELANATTLAFPMNDAPLSIMTDASNAAIGGV